MSETEERRDGAAPAVFRVAPENITPLWPQLEPLIAGALQGRPTHTAEDVRRMLLAQACHLWIQWHAPVVEALAITEFATYPQGVWLRVWIDGARRDRRQRDDLFFQALDGWRQSHRCRGFEAIGRHGWLRRVPEAQVEGLLMRMTQA